METVLFFVYSNKYICANRIAGAHRYAERRGWNIQVVERNNRRLDVKGVIDFWKPIGIIAECGGGIPELSRKMIGKIPLVYLDEDPNGEKGRALYVNSDSPLVGELAAKELLLLNLPHYAFVGWREPRFWSEDRRKAFQAAVRLHGKDCFVFECPPKASDERRKALLGKWIKALPKPCGIFAVHDPVAEDVLQQAAALGLAVPEDIAVIGVDDDPIICERTTPPLTSIGLDFEQGGFLCAQLLDDCIRDPKFRDAKHRYGVTSITRRLSTRSFKMGDRRVARAIALIRRTACEGVTVPMVAAVMGLKRRMAEIVFRRETGHSIHDEICDVRLERVETLLRNPRQQISVLAEQCGWKSPAALRAAFHAKHGKSPAEWRAGLQGN
jgi:LacI family transcriptional regulator